MPPPDGQAPASRRSIPLHGLDERERNMLSGFQMLSANVADVENNSSEDVVHFYREAQICGKTDLAVDWMLECLPVRPGEAFDSERRQVLAECVASLMGPGTFVENLNAALDQGASEPNQRMIDQAKRALRLVAILGDARCAESLVLYTPLGKEEHDLWLTALSRVPDARCGKALLAFVRRGRLFVGEAIHALEEALTRNGASMDVPVLRQISELDHASGFAMLTDGTYAPPQDYDTAGVRKLAAEVLKLAPEN